MADRYDNSFSRRPGSPDGNSGRRNDQPAPAEDDPLVELARIVSGKSSFDDIVSGRGPAAPVVRPAQQPNVRDTSFDLESELMNDLQTSFDPAVRSASGRPIQVEPQPPRAVPPRDEGFDHMRLRPGAPASAPQWQPVQPPRQAEPRYQQPEAYAQPHVEEDDPYAGTAYAGATDYGRDRGQPAHGGGYAAQGQYHPGQENGADDHSAGYDSDYGDDPNAVYEDDGYDDHHPARQERFAEPRRSRKPLIAAAVVLGVVLVGGLGAMALKGTGATSDGAPRIIAADEGPTKVQPTTQPTDGDVAQNKLIYDRASPELAGDEQLVLPDDGPIDEKPAANESQASREISRIILPGAPGDSANPQSIDDLAGGDASAPSAPADVDAGPRKVRTVVVKPDGTIISSEAQPRNAGSQGTQAAAPTAAAAPEADAPLLTADAEPAAAPAAKPQKDASHLEAPAAAPAPAAPRAQPAAPAAPAAAPRAAASGGFVVQVASQRTEEQALASYKAMQRKFPSVFGNQEPNVVRADLGAKGIYYRARVGPMATRDQAVSFCESLRSAGGDCIVQKN